MKINANSQLVCEKLASKVTREKATCEAHDEKLNSHTSLSFHEYFARKAISRGARETLCLANLTGLPNKEFGNTQGRMGQGYTCFGKCQ